MVSLLRSSYNPKMKYILLEKEQCACTVELLLNQVHYFINTLIFVNNLWTVIGIKADALIHDYANKYLSTLFT